MFEADNANFGKTDAASVALAAASIDRRLIGNGD
jgi:hypothetical protein